jgi:DNA-binding MarR family transcriptional regulator
LQWSVTLTEKDHAEYSSDELVSAARRLDMALSEWHGELSGRLEMGVAEAMSLAHLALDHTIGPSELGQRLHMTTGAMTALLDRLAERGYVVREPHATDRRRVALRLTAKAHDEARLHVRPMAADIRDLARRFSPDERQTIGRFIDDLTAIVRRHAAGS